MRISRAPVAASAAVPLLVAYFASPAIGRCVVFLSAALLATVAFAMRIVERRGRVPAAWFTACAAMLCISVNCVGWVVVTQVQHRASLSASLWELANMLGYVLLGVAVLQIVVARSRRNPASSLDTALFAVVISGLAWELIIQPRLLRNGLPMGLVAENLVELISLVTMAAVIARLALDAREARPVLSYFAGSLVAAVVGTGVFDFTSGDLVWQPGSWLDGTWITAFCCLAAAALHPTLEEITKPSPRDTEVLTIGRLWAIGCALIVGPLLAGVDSVLGRPADGLLLAFGATLVVPMAMVRIGGLVADRERVQAALAHQAAHDALTGLANRTTLVDRLHRAMEQLRRDGAGAVAVLFCDLDGFKQVNDAYGHAVGDALLVAVAERLRRCVRGGDVVARFGGDEFVIVCTDLVDAADAEVVHSRITAAFANGFALDGRDVEVGVSIGTALAEDGESDPDELLRRADHEMYAVKQRRRFRVA